MNLHNASLTISAVKPQQYPPTTIPEIALAGRSNVGKSSFVNNFSILPVLANNHSYLLLVFSSFLFSFLSFILTYFLYYYLINQRTAQIEQSLII